MKNACKAARRVGVFVIALAGDEVYVPLLLQQPEVVTVKVRHVIHRVVEVDVIVVIIAIVITANVIRTAHGDHAVEEVWTAEELIGAVKRAEAGPRRDDATAIATTVPTV